MKRERETSALQTPSSQSGFVLPVTIALIVALAYLLTTTFEQIAEARARASVFTQSNLGAFDYYAIEQEIAFRALQQVRQSEDNLFATSIPRRAPVDAPLWITDGTAHIWSSPWSPAEGSGVGLGQVTISVQDAAGLLDINYPNRAYLTFLASFLEIPATEIRRAVVTLEKTIIDLRATGENSARPVFGFKSPQQLCRQPVWQEAKICGNSDLLSVTLTAQEGGLPYFRTMSSSLKSKLVPDLQDLQGGAAEAAWNQRATEYGFYDPFSISASGVRFVVTLSPDASAIQSRFMLNLLYDLTGPPYSITERRVLLKDPVPVSSD